jgi:YidC/Oxa1 family membrane protein insertase
MSGLFDVPIDAAYHLVSALAGAFSPLPGGLAAAAAIVACTVLVRLLVSPLGYRAFRGERARARLTPKVTDLRRRHAHQPERLQRELAAHYRQEGSGVFAGCLPALLQVPFFAVMYRLFLSTSIAGTPNALLRQHLLGTSLGSHWLTGAGPFSTQGLVFCGLFVLLALVAVLSIWLSRRAAAQPAAQSAAQPGGVTGVLTRLMPFATVVIAAVVPLAAGLYLLTTTAWAAAERLVFRRLATAREAGGPTPGV